MDFFSFIESTAVSLTVSGNTGISPFLTLFLVGVIEKSDPDLLNMDGTIEQIVSSWPSIFVLGILTVLEVIGKCVPVIDEFIDSIEVFIVPVLSVLGSVATLGLFETLKETSADRKLELYDISGNSTTGSSLDLFETSEQTFADSSLIFIKGIIVVIGVGLSFGLHLFKMLIRVMGLGCLGCCQPCITITELTFVSITIFLSIYVRQIAVITAIILFLMVVFMIRSKCIGRRGNKNEKQQEQQQKDRPQTHGQAVQCEVVQERQTSQGQLVFVPMAQGQVLQGQVLQARVMGEVGGGRDGRDQEVMTNANNLHVDNGKNCVSNGESSNGNDVVVVAIPIDDSTLQQKHHEFEFDEEQGAPVTTTLVTSNVNQDQTRESMNRKR